MVTIRNFTVVNRQNGNRYIPNTLCVQGSFNCTQAHATDRLYRSNSSLTLRWPCSQNSLCSLSENMGLYFCQSKFWVRGVIVATFLWKFGERKHRNICGAACHSGEVEEIDSMKVCHHWFQSWPLRSAPLILFKTTVTQRIVNFG